jgi:uncharacterized protein (DUF1015 family)
VADVASVPYDVVSTEEARALAASPRSFLHVTRSEIDLPTATNPYDEAVYAQAARNLEELKRSAPLVQDDEPALYAYRLRMGSHEQTGIAGGFSVDEYERGSIKKHEKTRPEKEDDRTRHIVELRAQTGLVFLTYRAAAGIDRIVASVVDAPPLYDFAAPDGVRHTVWRIGGEDGRRLVDAYARLDALYIADGHHRAASAARARHVLARGGRPSGADWFMAVAFPDSEMQVLSYNRVVRDLNGLSPQALMDALAKIGGVRAGAPSVPRRKGEVSVFLEGAWHTLELPPAAPGSAPADTLDVAVLQSRVLGPVLGVGDPRTDKRIDFVGGIRGPAELERLVTSGAAAVAFSMFPVSVDDLMAIADAGGIMPPKSTWFEPKLRDGVLVHLI